MKEFWNERFASHSTIFGSEPNRFFKHFINYSKPGSILLPAEGEGRNAIYAASKGWEVDVFDHNADVREKALQMADERGVRINYELLDLRKFKATKQYDAIGLFYIQLQERLRLQFHQEICRALKPGGILVLEAFAREQIHNESGGPKDISLLYDAPMISNDFQHLYLLHIRQKETSSEEGMISVLRFVGQKL